jgi:hypothetical protein
MVNSSQLAAAIAAIPASGGGGGGMPANFVLTPDASQIPLNCASGGYFYVTLGAASGGNRFINNPSNPTGGYKGIVEFRQGRGNIGVTFGNKWRFGTSIPTILLTPTNGKSDKVGFIYNSLTDTFDVIAFTQGY